MNLKSISFIFENCDRITIDGKYVGDFVVDDLTTSIQRTACNAIERIDIANTFAIEIHRDANKPRYAFGQVGYENFKENVFDRFVAWNDITYIQFELIDVDAVGENGVLKTEFYEYALHWTGDSDYINASQVNYISQEGHLYIIIAEDKEIAEFFDLDQINDSEAMDFHFSMYDVGDVYGDPDRYSNIEVKVNE